MGCMSSRPSPNANADPNQPDQPAGAPANRNEDNVVVDRINEVINGDRTINGRPNKNLRSPSPVPKCPSNLTLGEPWTRRRLAREREAFFDTRVTGDPQTWAALKIACEHLRNNDVAGAQTMLDNLGLTCPTGRIKYERPQAREGQPRGHKGGVFDERGQRYDIPGWLVSDPLDLVPDAPNEGDETEAEEDAADHHPEKLGSLDGASDLSVEPSAEKGKHVVGNIVQVRARLSNGAQDVTVECGLKEKVKVLGQRIREKAGLEDGKKVKLVYLGRMMDQDKALIDCAWKEGHVVNALVVG
ncbi:hypothetical protein MBLNU457_5347t1 [Dothideomycetes sp. NU457]